MITEAFFMGVEQARRLAPSANTVIISMLDQSEEIERPKHLDEFKDCLAMHFFDATEQYYEDEWPDQLSDQQHVDVCGSVFERAPELDDARRIVEFLDRHHQDAAPIVLIAHCYAGISRSAAVAQFAEMTYGARLPQVEDCLKSTGGASSRLLRLMCKAHQIHKAQKTLKR